jgi:hypothetical protein
MLLFSSLNSHHHFNKSWYDPFTAFVSTFFASLLPGPDGLAQDAKDASQFHNASPSPGSLDYQITHQETKDFTKGGIDKLSRQTAIQHEQSCQGQPERGD